MSRLKSLTLQSLIAMLLAVLAMPSLAWASDRYRADARLFGPTALKGQARYEERPRDSATERRFKVEVEQGSPGQVLNVRVNGNLVGSLVVNGLGRGQLQLRTAQFIDDPGDGDPMPAGFPRLRTGDIVQVGPITGVIFLKDEGSTNVPPPSDTQTYRLRGDLSGPGLASGNVDYREIFRTGGGLERRFKVEVEDAAPNANFQIRINGRVVGTATTDGTGFVEFQLRTAAFIDNPGDGEPMPSNFPSLQDGDQVRVGNLVTVLNATGSGGGDDD